MTKCEMIFDQLEENGVNCFESEIPEDGDFDQIYRNGDDFSVEDVCDASTAWLFSDSVGQALAIQRD